MLKPEHIQRIAKLFAELTNNKHRLKVMGLDGIYEKDLTCTSDKGMDQLIERSLLAAINTVIRQPNTRSVKQMIVLDYTKEIKPECNEYMASLVSKKMQ